MSVLDSVLGIFYKKRSGDGLSNSVVPPALMLRPDEVHSDMDLKDMVRYGLSENYVFHGSPVKLTPGLDVLEPRSYLGGKKVLYLGDFSSALRFSLVRGWGYNQKYAFDFYAYVTDLYKIVVYHLEQDTDNLWHNQDVDKSVYIYAVPKRFVPSLDALGGVRSSVPICACAQVNQQTLADAGFKFVPDMGNPLRFWWIRNNNQDIEKLLLPDIVKMYTRQK